MPDLVIHLLDDEGGRFTWCEKYRYALMDEVLTDLIERTTCIVCLNKAYEKSAARTKDLLNRFNQLD